MAAILVHVEYPSSTPLLSSESGQFILDEPCSFLDGLMQDGPGDFAELPTILGTKSC